MARIQIYGLDSEIDPADKVIGTDGQPGVNYGKTKNYSIAELASYFSGTEGQAGASAYQIWLDNGNTGTEQDFLDSLVGEAGAQGPTGAAGANGANGTNGTNGTNGVDGQDGAQGEPGADGTSINIQGTVETVGNLPPSGSLGDLWIVNTAGGGADAGDGYVWTAENEWLNIGPLRGPQGIQGVPGVNGADGTDGVDGVDGVDGAQGPQGIQGPQGPQGPQGIQGEPGDAGTTIYQETGNAYICDLNGDRNGDYANLNYDMAQWHLCYSKTEREDFIGHLRVSIQVINDNDFIAFTNTEYPIAVLLDNLPLNLMVENEPFGVPAQLTFTSNPGKVISSGEALRMGDNLLKITASTIDVGNRIYEGFDGIATSLMSSGVGTKPLSIRLAGTFMLR
jgi:hypothetical protein